MASIGIGFLGEPSLARLLEPVFGGLSHGVAAALSLAFAFALVMILIAVWIFRTDRLLTGRLTKGSAGPTPRKGIWRLVNLPRR